MSSQAMEQAAGGQHAASYGLDPEMLADLERQFGFDKPVHVRFFTMVWNYLQAGLRLTATSRTSRFSNWSWSACRYRFLWACGRCSSSTA